MEKIKLTAGLYALVDAVDVPMLSMHSWHAAPRRDGKGFYAKNTAGQRMHRLLMGVDDGRIVDHIDGDGLDNRRSNLRIGSQSQNCVNRRDTPGPYLRGARPKKGLWQAYIKFSEKQKSLGYFKTEAEAHAAYLAAALKMHGDWMPLPAAPGEKCRTCSGHGAVGNILTAEPCPDCTPAAAAAESFEDRMSDWAHGDALDAARYRWLRDNATRSGVNIDIGAGVEISETLDAAVDDAMRLTAAKESP